MQGSTTIVRVTLKTYEPRKNVKKTLYEILYADGTALYTPVLSMGVLHAGGVEPIAPTYCHPCRTGQPHIYYKAVDQVRCIICFSNLDESDDRPIADLLSVNDFLKGKKDA
jgi:hypothetical protein